MKEALPFVSSNSALSLALDCFVAPVWRIWNVYNDGRLEKINCKSVREALEKNISGTVFFWFHDTAEVKSARAAWDDQQAAFRDKREVQIEVSAEDAMRIACTFHKRTEPWRGLWKKGEPIYGEWSDIVKNEATGKLDDGTPYEGTITHPGVKLISMNASASTRAKMGL